MRVLTAAVATVFAALMISGCTSHEEMASMDPEESAMEQHMDNNMNAGTMMEDSATEPMKPKMESMEKTMKDETMMEDSASESMKPKMETMDQAGQ